MKENTYKPIKNTTLFSWLTQVFHLNAALRQRIATHYARRLLYLLFLGLFYIWNAHYHEKMIYTINQLQPIVNGLRVKYMRLQSNYMLHSKQSTIAKRVAPLGIVESSIPPYIITINPSVFPKWQPPKI